MLFVIIIIMFWLLETRGNSVMSQVDAQMGRLSQGHEKSLQQNHLGADRGDVETLSRAA